MKAVVTVNIEKMPEVIHRLMQQIADALRLEADSEADPRVARKLRAIAARFEAGQ